MCNYVPKRQTKRKDVPRNIIKSLQKAALHSHLQDTVQFYSLCFKNLKKLRAVRETEVVQQSLILLVSSLVCGTTDNCGWARAGIRLQNTSGQLNNAHSGSSCRIVVVFYLCFIHLTFSCGRCSSNTALQTLPLCCPISPLSKHNVLHRQHSIYTCRPPT